MESTWIPKFEACRKNNGFVKGTFESSSKMLHVFQNINILVFIIMLFGMVPLIYQARHLESNLYRYSFLLHTCNEILRVPCLTIIWNRAKSGSGAPGPESAPRGTKSTTFAKVFFQPFNLPKFWNTFRTISWNEFWNISWNTFWNTCVTLVILH